LRLKIPVVCLPVGGQGQESSGASAESKKIRVLKQPQHDLMT
jgi:hypothetical protein